MKRLIRLTVLLASAMALPASASMAGYGTISSIVFMKNGAVLFNTSAERTNPLPACQSASFPKRYALDASTIAGQTYASGLLTAYALGKKVSIQGAGTCDIWWDTETVSHFTVED